MVKTTTINGVVYTGRPKMGSTAFGLVKYEAEGRHQDAANLLRAVNMIRRVDGRKPYDPQEDMTTEPMEGGFTFGRHADVRR